MHEFFQHLNGQKPGGKPEWNYIFHILLPAGLLPAYAGSKKLLISEHLRPLFRDQHRVLPLCRQASVFCIDGPAVFLVLNHIGPSRIYHRFNGKDHAGNQKHIRSPLSDMADPRFLMEIIPHAVAADLTHYRKTICINVLGYGSSYVAQMAPGPGFLTSFSASGDTFPMQYILEASP